MISGHGTIATAVDAIKQGAYDFIEKPFEADRLLLVLGRALEAARLRRENEELKSRAGEPNVLIGQCPSIVGLRRNRRARGPHGQPRADHRPRRVRQRSGGAPDFMPVRCARRTLLWSPIARRCIRIV